jgi:hypothetical protein
VDGVDVEITSHTPGYISYVTYVSLADEELVKGTLLATACSLGYNRASQRSDVVKNHPAVILSEAKDLRSLR